QFTPKLGGQFELESGGQFALELVVNLHWKVVVNLTGFSTNLLFDFIFFAIIVTVLLAIFISAIIYFFFVTNSWVQSNYKSDKLFHSIISGIVIIGIYFTIKTIINKKIKNFHNSFHNIPHLLLKGIPK
ncbi:hypothetical protein, partial [Flavobacterium sp. LB1P62]|uniref:hypothetical protein n=1 Tax=Flavobacterium sp. LB1P62 TaxID=3401715 RepID=UPI003AAAE8DA